MVPIFERPLPPGWIYPCTTADLEERLRQFPTAHLDGLLAVGLVPSTRKDCWANARYLPGLRPVIHVFSFPESLAFRQPRGVKQRHVDAGLAVEREYGMRVSRSGSRWLCEWAPEDLRRFILDFVLPHEIGHHVFHRTRSGQGWAECPGSDVCEQYANAYAARSAQRLAPSLSSPCSQCSQW